MNSPEKDQLQQAMARLTEKLLNQQGRQPTSWPGHWWAVPIPFEGWQFRKKLAPTRYL